MTMTGQAGSHAAGRTMTVGGPLGDGHLSAQVEVDASGAATLFGQAPGSVAKVEVVDSAGAVLGEAAANGRLVPAHAPREPGVRSGLARRAVGVGSPVGTVPIGVP